MIGIVRGERTGTYDHCQIKDWRLSHCVGAIVTIPCMSVGCQRLKKTRVVDKLWKFIQTRC